MRPRIVHLGMLLCAAIVAHAISSDAQATNWWKPAPTTNLYYQLGKLFNVATDLKANVQAYVFDGFDTPTSTVTALKQKGFFPICYFSAGTYENWRADKASFNASVLGSPLPDWPGERWLDIRQLSVRNIMAARMQMCKSKGFVAVDPDNVDGYSNNNGFRLTAADQLAFHTFLSTTAHRLGLGIGLKNDLAQAKLLVNSFDWALNEQCWQYNECGLYKAFVTAKKPVYNIEYSGSTAQFCPKAKAAGIKSALYNMELNGRVYSPCK